MLSPRSASRSTTRDRLVTRLPPGAGRRALSRCRPRRRLPIAAPEPVGNRQVPVDMGVVAPPGGRVIVVGGQQCPAVGRPGRIEGAEVGAAVMAHQHREGERTAGQGLQVRVRQQPGHQAGLQAEGGGIAVDARECAHRVEDSVKRRPDRLLAEPGAGSCPADPGSQHVRHGMLLRGREHHSPGQPVEQECLGFGRAHPQRPAEVPVASVVDDVIGAPARGRAVREVLGLVGGEELGDEHGPAVFPPCLPPGGHAASAAAGRPGDSSPGRRERPDTGPDKRMVGRERRTDRRVSCRIGDREG